MKGLFLDDERNPEDVTWIEYPDNVEWDIVRNRMDFNVKAAFRQYDIISFDHDLQDFEEDGTEHTGLCCLKDLAAMEVEVPSKNGTPDVVFHTQNIVGKDNMKFYWQNFLLCTRS